MTKKNKYIILFFLLTFVVGFFGFYNLERAGISNKKQVIAAKSQLPIMTEKDLSPYNGDDPSKPIYMGLDGYVYDVTKGKEFYKPGGSYHDLVGHDSTTQLKIFGGDIIKRKYPIVAVLKNN